MKRWISLMMLAVLMCLCAGAAAQSSDVEIISEAAYAVESYGSVYGCAYAFVRNNGKSMAHVTASCAFFDSSNRKLGGTDYMTCYPDYLAPGETGYVFYSYTNLKDVTSPAQVADYEIKVDVPYTSDSAKVTHYPHTVKLFTTTSGSSTSKALHVYVENDTDELLFRTHTVVAILDENGTPVYIGSNYLSDAGILPGSTTVSRISIPEYIVKFFDANGFEIRSVDSMAFTMSY